jgi:hypothetical protein
VTVAPLTGGGLPDLVVTNGGSGTVTVLPGVGQGFFDDQHPQTLFDLGSALVQAPAFVGASGLGYAVTAGGQLVRFDLADPSGGANVVFAGADVLAAQAEASGLVVVALAGGAVDVLAPNGNGLSVAAQLQAQGGVPILPSALQVLQTASGHLQVLVSSQGSDAIFVFSAASSSQPSQPPTVPPIPVFIPPPPSGSSTSSAGGTDSSRSSLSTSQVPILAATNGSVTSTLGGTGSASASSTSSTGPQAGLTASVESSTGLSLSGASSHDNSAASSGTAAVLVPIQGNNYATVALLDFGGGQDDDPPDGKRMSWLGNSHPLGDTSPLMRFVTGHDEALQQYRGGERERLPDGGDAPLQDLWNEDLFHLPHLSRPPVRGREDDQPREDGPPDPLLSGPDENPLLDNEALGDCLWDHCLDDALLLPPITVARKGAAFQALTVMLTGILLVQAQELSEQNRRGRIKVGDRTNSSRSRSDQCR